MGRRKRDPKIKGIYLIISPNNRAYVGLAKDIIYRWNQYKNGWSASQPHLHNSFSKYGVESHDFIILEEIPQSSSDKELSDLEIYYYWYVKSLGFPMINLKFPGYNGKHSPESIEKKSGKNHYNWGKRGAQMSRSKPIFQYSLIGEFIKEWESASTVRREIGTNSSHIIQCCKGNAFSIGGFRWAYKGKLPECRNEETERVKRMAETGSEERVCYQYNKNGDFIAEYPSIGHAHKATRVSRSSIILTALKKGGNKSAGGYMWFYDYKGEKTTPYNQRDYYKTAGAAKRVYQYTLTNKFVEEYSGAAEASRQTGISYNGIMRVSRGEQKSTGNYIFNYNKVAEAV